MEDIGILDIEGEKLNPLTNEKYSELYQELAKVWSKLPAYKKRKEIINAINENNVIFITSGTGSGKTVLVPKFALHSLEYKGKIGVTFPKKSIAQSAAEFSATTLDVELGEQIGYKYRGSPGEHVSSKNKILYATDGTIVAKLMNDPELREFNIIIVDEVHERNTQIDLLIYLLKNALKLRTDLKLIFMSATVNIDVFNKYFNEFNFRHIDVGGETNYPIKSYYLSKPVSPKNYLDEGINKIIELDKEFRNDNKKIGGIIFFVVSTDETRKVCDSLSEKSINGLCVDLSSSKSEIKYKQIEDNQKLIEKSKDKYLIIIATPVAESSLTVKGIKYVIDSGLEISATHDSKMDAKKILTDYISQAQVKQRKGRAGRTAPGIAYHLYTEGQYENFNEYPNPDIITTDLKEISLKILDMPGVETVENLKLTFSKFIEPPPNKKIKNTIQWLRRYELIDKNGKISTLGKIVKMLKLDIQNALVIFCSYHLKCLWECLGIILMIDSSNINNITDIFIKDTDDNNDKIEKSMDGFRDNYLDINILLKLFHEFNKKIDDKNKFVKYSKKKFIDYNNFSSKFYYLRNSKDKNKNKKKGDKLSINYYTIKNLLEGYKRLSVNDYDIKYRVLASFLWGYRYNILKKEKNNNYVDNVRDIKIELNPKKNLYPIKNPPKKLFYKNLTIMEQKMTVSFTGKITDTVYELYKLFKKNLNYDK